MPAERSPSGTGHDTAGEHVCGPDCQCGCAAGLTIGVPRVTEAAPAPAPSIYEGTPKPHGIACRCSECAPPVAVPGPASPEKWCPRCERLLHLTMADPDKVWCQTPGCGYVGKPASGPGPASVSPAEPPTDLPERVVVGANGAYWRDYGDFYSMCPISTDNDPVEVVAVYERADNLGPDASAADVDGAESPSGSRGHHESVGERQGRQPAQDTPVVSPADTPAYKRLAAMLAEGEGLDDAQPMYSPLGELRAFKAEFAALLAAGERDRAEIERLAAESERWERRAWNAEGRSLKAGERDRQQIARLTEAAKAADMAMRWHYEDVIPTAEVPDEATAFEVAIALVRAVLASEEDAAA